MVKDPYNNKDYNGNNCNKLLKNIDKLRSVIPQDLETFVDVLEALMKVKEACFGAEADPEYKQIVKNFEAAWFEIYIEHDVWFTNKCHVIIDHVPQAIERTGRGLLGNSEQVVEASHAIFDRFWKKYLVVDLESDTHMIMEKDCYNV